MQRKAHISLANLLKNMADQFRGYDICAGRVLIEGEALTSLVQTLDEAAAAAAQLENRAQAEVCLGEQPGSAKIIRFRPRWPRSNARARSLRHSPWRVQPTSMPGMIHADEDDDGGDAA